MPEGDTIFRAATTLARALTGSLLTRFETGYAQLASVDDDAPLIGRTVEKIWAHGKHLYMGFSGELILHTHMRMNGSWHIYRPGEAWQRPKTSARIVLGTEKFVAVAFDVPVADFQTPREQQRSENVLGPDLLSPTFDPEQALQRLRARGDLDLAAALLNQRVMAGVGNVYKSELCFLTGLDPRTPMPKVGDAKLRELIAIAQKLLRENVAPDSPEAIVTYRGLRRTTGRDNPSERLWVYGRGGEPCRKCRTKIVFYKQGEGARSTYCCPQCQPPVR